jgi:hypothetical protein
MNEIAFKAGDEIIPNSLGASTAVVDAIDDLDKFSRKTVLKNCS